MQMKRLADYDADAVAVTINGQQKQFLLGTGASLTQVERSTAEALKLPIHQGRTKIYDSLSDISRDEASVDNFTLGYMQASNATLPISALTDKSFDGVLSLDYLAKFDVDIDFGSDALNFFSPDHCDGQVVYWTSPRNVAIVPILTKDLAIYVPVTVDGKPMRARIDTGVPTTVMRMDEEQRLFNLTLGDGATPQALTFFPDPNDHAYTHIFKTLTFGNKITVDNPLIAIYPDIAGRNAEHSQLVDDRAKVESDSFKIPDIDIGMDVLRELHLYIAFGEHKMYVSCASMSGAACKMSTN